MSANNREVVVQVELNVEEVESKVSNKKLRGELLIGYEKVLDLLDKA